MELEDKWYDLYEANEQEIEIYQEYERYDFLQHYDFEMTPRPDQEYVNVYIRAGSQMNFYKREGYDLLTYLGDLGGLFDIVFILGSIITSFLTTKLFTATLIS